MNPDPSPLAPKGRATRKLPWWTRLPGMNWRDAEQWPDMLVADAVCAMACTARLIKISKSPRHDGAKRTADDARHLRDWLDKAADDKDAYNPKWVLEWAQALHRY